MDDQEIINGLNAGSASRQTFEKELYLKYVYFIKEGIHHYHLSHDDSFSAYSDALLTVVHNVVDKSFAQRSSLKTYFYKIFSNKCIDQVRKNTTAKGKVNNSVADPETLVQLPDNVRSVIENLVENQRVQALRQQIETIGEKCKQILLLFQDGYTDREIAELTGYNNSSVAKVTRLRCLEKIREKMKGFISTE
ncbi:MAG: sigma-70 family RNA polymerase sigma factor [Flavitalea sp.]